MKYDRNKAFPYPVLSGYSDDYTHAAFQASSEIRIDDISKKVVIDVIFDLSEQYISNLIDNGKAVFAILTCIIHKQE